MYMSTWNRNGYEPSPKPCLHALVCAFPLLTTLPASLSADI